MKNKKVCNETRSPPASLLFKGQSTEHRTLKWPITHFWTFLCRCFARLQRETSRNVLVTCLMEEVSYVFLFTFFSLLLIFTVVAATNFPCCSSNKKCLLCFFISRSGSLSLFFSLSFAVLSPSFSFSLFFSLYIFQICGHDN